MLQVTLQRNVKVKLCNESFFPCITFKKRVIICNNYFMIYDPDHKTEHLTTMQAIILQECNVFDMLLSNGGDTQSGVSESPMRINKISIRNFIDM